jgi:anaerobic selenocysteine-containing dehydrogenase
MPPTQVIRTTCPRDCYDACGIAVAKRDDGKIKVLGDPDHSVSRGALCGKCAIAYNGAWLDPKIRLTQPLKRIGAKGDGKFAPVSWDEAIDAIASQLKTIASRHGTQTIWHAHYTGTCSLIAGGFPQRLLNRLGASEIEPDSICNAAGHAALQYMYGTSVEGFDPRMAKDAAAIVIWGANPATSAPHQHKHWIRETSAKIIVVDPVKHPTAAAAHLHLHLFPGSDAALAFAIAHVLMRDGGIDRTFLAAHAIGWEELEPEIARCTPEWAAPITGVTVAEIKEAAHLFGAGPALLWMGQGLQRQPMGGNVFRAVAMLSALKGDFAKPGAGFLFLNGGGRRGLDGDYVEASHLRSGKKQTASHMDLVDLLADAERSRALITWNINLAASNPRQADLHRQLKRDDLFHVAIDCFATDTTDFADFVLPAASFLEFDDMVSPYFHLSLSAQAKATEAIGQSLPNQEIFRRLARAIGFTEPELFEDDATILDTLARQAGLADFAALKPKGTVDLVADPVPLFPDLAFPTPSGKIELKSARAEADGHPALPLPIADPRPAGAKLRLLSPASPWLMNSSYHEDAKIAEKIGPETVLLHPADAARLALSAGDLVSVRNATGRLIMKMEIGEIVPKGVALAHKSRWPKLLPGRLNINALNPGQKTDMAESSAVHGIEVEVVRA